VRKQQYDQQIEAGEETNDLAKNKMMLKHSEEHLSFKTKKKSSPWVCDHCKGKVRFRQYCFKLHGQSKNPHRNSSKKKWIPRNVISGLRAHTSLRASSKEDWYFDSGCPRNMTGVDKYLENMRPYTSSYVTFGDGAKEKIVGICNLIKHGLPRLVNVLLVKGLTANLISISQLCDQGLEVNFTKLEC